LELVKVKVEKVGNFWVPASKIGLGKRRLLPNLLGLTQLGKILGKGRFHSNFPWVKTPRFI